MILNSLKFKLFNDKIMRAALSLFCLSIVNYLVKYALNTFVSNKTNPALYGDYSMTIRTILLLSLIFLLGTNSAAEKYLSKYLSKKNTRHIYSFLAWNLDIIFKTFKICLWSICIFYTIILILHFINIENITSYRAIIYAVWIIPIIAFDTLLASYLLCNKWTLLSFFANKMAFNIFFFILFALCIYILHVKINYFLVIVLIFVSAVAVLVFELYWLGKMIRQNNINMKYKIPHSALLIRPEWHSESIKFISTQTVVLIISTISLYIIDFTHSSDNLTGYYTAILILSGIIWLIPSSLSLLIRPNVNLLTSENRFKKFQSIVNTVNFINIFALSLFFLLIIVFGKGLLSTFGGANFEAFYLPLVIQSGAFFIGAVIKPAEQTLTFCNLKKEIRINIYEFSALILSGIPLAYVYNITGMTIAVAFSITIKTVLVYYYLKKEIPIKPLTFF